MFIKSQMPIHGNLFTYSYSFLYLHYQNETNNYTKKLLLLVQSTISWQICEI